jgi:hypothetical protein
MKKYTRLTEDIYNDIQEYVNALDKTIRKIFPKSYIHVKYNNSLYSSISISFALGKDKNEWVSGYIDNDTAWQRFSIDNKGKDLSEDPTLPEFITVDTKSNSFTVKPEKDSYMAFGRVKVPFRKTTGTPDKVLKYIEKYFILLKKMLQDNKDNIPEEHLELIADKF